MRDNRVRQLATIDDLARMYRRYPLFVFKSDGAKVIYVFGKRVAKLGWHDPVYRHFRPAYIKYHKEIEHILREPTEQELAGMLPAFHPLERNGKQLTVGEYRDFTKKAWHAKQVSDIVRLIQREVEK